MEIRTLKNRWDNLFKTLAEDTLIEEGFSELIHKYSEKHRHYHNINHIKECLTALDQVQTDLKDSFSLEAAVWFHDVIYDPKQSENEHLSAEHAKSFLIDTAADMMTIRKADFLVLQHSLFCSSRMVPIFSNNEPSKCPDNIYNSQSGYPASVFRQHDTEYGGFLSLMVEGAFWGLQTGSNAQKPDASITLMLSRDRYSRRPSILSC